MWITKLRKVIQGQTQLFTLKHSRLLASLTLKDSRFSAETLPDSIYTYIYIYKKTNSCWLKTVDNCNKWAISLLGCFVILTLSSCCCSLSQAEKEQENALHLSVPPPKCFKQNIGSSVKPPEYYSCEHLHGNRINCIKPRLS